MVTPFITFYGNCKEALLFYQNIFQSEIKAEYLYGEYIPDGVESPPEDLCNWILHAEMQIYGSNFWFADVTEAVKLGDAVKLTASVPNSEVAQTYFDRLKEDGRITLPPTETFYNTFHAAVTDKYGVCWNIVAEEVPD